MMLGLSLALTQARGSGAAASLALTADTSLYTADNGVITADATLQPVAVSTLAPSSLWTGTAGSGFDATGVSAFVEPTPSVDRIAGDPVRPSMRNMFRSFETIDRQTTFGILAAFSGYLNGPQGLAYVQVDLEGARKTIIAPSDYTLTDVNGTDWPMHLHNFVFDFAGTVARHSTGRVKFYLTAVANDPAADPLVLGPFYITPRTAYVTAPWDTGGPAIYDHVYMVDKTGVIGGSYLTLALAFAAAVAAGAKSPLWVLCRDGGHACNFTVAGPTNPLEWGTIMADPRTVSTGAWVGDGTSATGFTAHWDGIQFQGWLTKVDITQFGVGWVGTQIGGSPAGTSMCFNGVEIYQGSGSGTPSSTTWNGVTGTGALYNGLIPSGQFTGASLTNIYWFECDIHDVTYGLSDGIARNCVGHKVFKFHQNIKGSYNCKLYEAGAENNPNAQAMDAIAVWYTGAASVAQVLKSSQNAVAGTLALIEDGVTSPSSPVINTTRTLQNVVDDINAATGWNATLLATTPDLMRNPVYLWYGSRPLQPRSFGVCGSTSVSTTPVTVSKNAGSPTKLLTIQDAHSDNVAHFGASHTLKQNRINVRFSSYGCLGAQTFFLDRSEDWGDMYLGTAEFHDLAYLISSSLSNASGFGGICSNVVEEYVTAMGAESRSFFSGAGGHPYVGDIYSKHHSTFYDNGYAGPASSDPRLTQFLGIANRLASMPNIGSAGLIATPDADSFFLDPATYALSDIFVDPVGVSPYGYRGAGTPPNLTPKTSTILKMPVSGAICGARDVAGALQLAA